MVEFSKYTTGSGQIKWQYYEPMGYNPKTGKQERLRKRGFRTRSEAKLYYEKESYEFHTNQKIKQSKKTTFNDFFENQFLPFYKNKGVSEGTVEKLKIETKKHIIPVIGDYYINMITVKDCQELVNFIKKRRKDYRKIIGHAKAIFKLALQEGYIHDSPIEKVIVTPSKEKYKKRRIATQDNVYTAMQLITFLNYLQENEEFNKYVYFRLLAFAGLRRGEALALKLSDINHEEKAIKVERTLTESAGGKTIVSEYTKTGNAHSNASTNIYLDDYTYEILVELTKQSKFKVSHHKFIDIVSREFIFVSPKTGTHLGRSAPNDWLNNIWKKHKIELEKLGLHYISPHGFRHSQASLLYELGVNPKDAQHRLRHKNLKTTMDIYTHISNEKEKTTVGKLNEFNSLKPTSKPTLITQQTKKA